MTDTEQLPYLMRLFDDENPVVRDSALGALNEFGSSLEEELAKLSEPPGPKQLEQLHELLEEYRGRVQSFKQDQAPVGEVISKAIFVPGQLVCHRRYGYRGVVVDLDLTFQATESWYLKNNTQPEREQPWYHVLVHGTQSVTYAAQTSLMPDDSSEEVIHPFVEYFFEGFENGSYKRNSTPWPESE